VPAASSDFPPAGGMVRSLAPGAHNYFIIGLKFTITDDTLPTNQFMLSWQYN
jgi:hypothetical protein